jgi:hypothetical protein
MHHDYLVMEWARQRAEELAMVDSPERRMLREARRARSRRRRRSWW